MKKVLAGLILTAIIINSTSVQAFAESSSKDIEEEVKVETIGEIGGYLEGNIKTVENLTAERKFNYAKGHGFAAERGNNLADVLVKAPRKEEIDNYLFKNFTKNITKQANNTSFFAGLKTKRNGKKADKLATEFNQPTGWLGKLLEIRNNAIQKKEEAKRLAKERKMLEKANAKTAKEVAKK